MALKTSLKVTPKDDPKSVAKVDKVDIKKDDKVALFNCVFLDTKEKKWLIDYLYFILRYLILINFDMIL